MNTLPANRLSKLQEICRKNNWGPSELARRVGSGTASHWSDLLRGQKSFGEKLARKIETNLGISPWSLDSMAIAPSLVTGPSARSARIAAKLDELPAGELREGIFDLCERLLKLESPSPNRKASNSKRVPAKKTV